MKQTKQSRKQNEAVRTALAGILLTEIADPRLDMVTVTSATVSKDRSVANVYFTADRSVYDEVEAGLESAKGRLRSLLGQELGWRHTPELRFFMDTTIDEAERIARVLQDVPPTLLVPKDEDGYPLSDMPENSLDLRGTQDSGDEDGCPQ